MGKLIKGQMRTILKKIFWKIFVQGSSIDHFTRKIYHYLLSSKIITIIKIKKSNNSIHKFLIFQKKFEKTIEEFNEPTINISFLLALNVDAEIKKLPIYKSLLSQKTNNWELIISMPRSLKSMELSVIKDGIDSHIKIIYQSNPCIEQMLKCCSCNFFVCCDADDYFSPSFLFQFNINHQQFPESIIFYTDSENINSEKKLQYAFFKPEKLSPELFFSVNYFSRSLIKNDDIVAEILSSNEGISNFFTQEWTLIFHLINFGVKVTHIPYILVRHTDRNHFPMEKIKSVLKNYSTKINFSNLNLSYENPGLRINWDFSMPLISIIVPTKNKTKILQRFIKSLFEITIYPDFELILVDNQSRNSNTLEYYKELLKNKRIRIISFQDKFNYSTANNIGASNSQGDLLLFMNNDMQITDPYWLKELAQWALIPDIGIVGGKLLYPNRTIQHAGVVVGMQGIGGHLYHHAPEHFIGLMGSADWYRNVSAVTGACLMLRRTVFKEIGCFQEAYQLTFSDIDLCYSAIKMGYRILYNPYSKVIHHQGISRGFYTPVEDIVLARFRLREFLENGDPYFSRNLTLSPIPKVKINS